MKITGLSGTVYTWDEVALGPPSAQDKAQMKAYDAALMKKSAVPVVAGAGVPKGAPMGPSRTPNQQPVTNNQQPATNNHEPPDPERVLHAKHPEGEGSVEGRTESSRWGPGGDAHPMVEAVLKAQDVRDEDPADQARSGGEIAGLFRSARAHRDGGLQRVGEGRRILSNDEAREREAETAKAALDLGVSTEVYEGICIGIAAVRSGLSVRDYLARERGDLSLREKPWKRYEAIAEEAALRGITVDDLYRQKLEGEAQTLGLTVAELQARRAEEKSKER